MRDSASSYAIPGDNARAALQVRDLDDLQQAADLVRGVINRHPHQFQGQIYAALMCCIHDITVIGRYLEIEVGR